MDVVFKKKYWAITGIAIILIIVAVLALILEIFGVHNERAVELKTYSCSTVDDYIVPDDVFEKVIARQEDIIEVRVVEKKQEYLDRPYSQMCFISEPKEKKDFYREYWQNYICEVTDVIRGDFDKGDKILFQGDFSFIESDHYSLDIDDKFYLFTSKKYVPITDDNLYALRIYDSILDIIYIKDNKVYPYYDVGFMEQFSGMSKRKFERQIITLHQQARLKYPNDNE